MIHSYIALVIVHQHFFVRCGRLVVMLTHHFPSGRNVIMNDNTTTTLQLKQVKLKEKLRQDAKVAAG